ncbi:molecular chaperone SurA [Ectothiorhodospiraceae bacterium BW-2]|nr:molecular chaperone SurA [Ectothiorhodospiraceae bacterium BW-2]
MQFDSIRLPLTGLMGVLVVCSGLLLSRGIGAEELDRIAAVVDEKVITLQQLNRQLERTITQIRQGGRSIAASPQLQAQVLERMILQRIKLQRAEDLGIRLGPEEIDRAIRRIAADNGLSLAQLQRMVEQQGDHFATFRQDIATEIILNQLKQRQVDNRITVTAREIDHYLQNSPTAQRQRDYRLRHILLALPDDPTPDEVAQLEQEAAQLRARVLQGESFAQLAIERSDAQQAFEGGDLGWRSADFLPQLFREVVPSMAVGDISPLLRNSSGFHLLKLEQFRTTGGETVRQVRAQHILLLEESGPAEELQQRLHLLRERLLQGESFAELAQLHSQDPVSAVNGGELDWAAPDSYVPRFRRQLEQLAIGELSEPFQSQFGWHIVKLLGWREHDNSQEVERTRAQQALKAQKVAEEEESWNRRLRSEAYVDIRL